MATDHKHHTHEGEEPAITRYDTWFDEWEESPTGYWVAYSEVEKLQKQLAQERARLDWLVENSMECLAVGQWSLGSGSEVGHHGDTAREAIDREISHDSDKQ